MLKPKWKQQLDNVILCIAAIVILWQSSYKNLLHIQMKKLEIKIWKDREEKQWFKLVKCWEERS